MKFTVSIVMATYNGAAYINEQLNSILNQTVLPDEIVVIDDASKDNTVKIIRTVLDTSTIKHSIIIHDSNRGVTKSFQEGILNATCDYIMICDQDDVWKSNKIELSKTLLDEDTSLVVCNATIVDSTLNPIGQSMFEYIKFPLVFNDRICILSSQEMMRLSLKRNYVTGMCMVGRREQIIKSFPIPTSMTYDTWLAWNLANCGQVKFINDELVYYRQHGNNVIGTKRKKESLREYYRHRKKDKLNILAKYSSLANVKIDDILINDLLGKSICFCKSRVSINEYSIFKAILIILKNKKMGYYNQFTSNGKREFIKDIIEVILFKNT